MLIERFDAGDRVDPHLPDGWDRTAVPLEGRNVDWRQVELVLLADNAPCGTATLLRPAAWVEEQGATPGEVIFLNLPEIGIEEPAEVVSIEETIVVPGPGRLVTGVFRHTSGEILDLQIEGEHHPLGTTKSHPFWSVDREDWVSAQNLEPGELLLNDRNQAVRLVSISERHEPAEVYNLEIDGDHCYRVGEQGLLVHNLSQSVNIFSEKYFGGDFATSGPQSPKYRVGGNGRAERTQARVCTTGGNTTPPQNPVGWNTEWNLGLPSGKAKVARCHLLARQLGGTHNDSNIVPCCQSDNREMKNIEDSIARFIASNGCVDILVVATYSGSRSKIPTTITLTAVGQDCSTGRRTNFNFTIKNPVRGMPSCPVAGS